MGTEKKISLKKKVICIESAATIPSSGRFQKNEEINIGRNPDHGGRERDELADEG